MKIDELLTPHRRHHTRLQKLLNQAARQNDWTRELQAVLPGKLGAACRVVDLRGETLVILCTDGAVATRLRFQASDILDRLGTLSHFSHIKHLEIRVSRAGDWSDC